MKRSLFIALTSLVVLGLSLSPVAGQPPAPAAPAEEGIDVQTRGPVHEAFAQPYRPDAQPASVVPRQPPPPVPEQPPEQKPPGDNVQWIPGYWSWDAERNDFTWVSGCWRVPPPGRQWVPGSWSQADGGWRWTPGSWAAANQQPTIYQEAPPASLENGPSIPAPNANSFYVPGCWVNRDNRYLWRPGFWQAFQPGWVWTDAQYTWTPRGCVFTDGYWDYGLEDRGLLFAPVAFTQPLWQTPGWSYRPGFAVALDGLLGSLFAGPRDGHYYFGDYYGARYRRAGFRPWHLARSHVRDSLFDYYRWRHRGDRGWYAGIVNRYRGRLQGTLPRPPRTFAEQTSLFRHGQGARDLSRLRMVTSVQSLRESQVRRSTAVGFQQTSRRVDVQSARAVARPRNRVEQSAIASVHEAARVTSRTARPLPRPGSRYAEIQRLSGFQAHGDAAVRGRPASRPSGRPAVAFRDASHVTASAVAGARAPAHGHSAAFARPAPRPGRAVASRSAPHGAPPRQARQFSGPARVPHASPAPRRAASPRSASPSRQRPAMAPRAARTSARPAPRASGRSGSSRSGKHR